jgi:hypothetical protein
MKHDDRGHNVNHSPVGATNSIYLVTDEEGKQFKKSIYCLQEITVLHLSKKFHHQRHSCLTATEVNAEYIEELFKHTTLLIFEKKEVNAETIKKIPQRKIHQHKEVSGELHRHCA